MGMKVNGSTGLTFPDSTTMATGSQAVRAWVNFNGTGTVAIRASYNVSSITDNGAGWFSVNFTTAMADTNYGVALSSSYANNGGNIIQYLNVNNGGVEVAPTTSKVDTTFINVSNNNVADPKYVYISIFR
jgi:hypothetical protein